MTAQLQDQGSQLLIAALGSNFWFQWGRGSNAPTSATGVTASGTEGRVQAVVTSGSNSVNLVGTILSNADGVRAITEVGVFDSAGSGTPPTGGNMIAYVDFSAVNIQFAGEGATFNITIEF